MGGRRTAWAVEGGLVALAAAVGALFLAPDGPADADPGRLTATGGTLLAGAVAGVGLVLFRRTRPVALTLVLIPLGIVFALPMGATMVALFSVAVRRGPWIVAAVTGLHAVLVAVAYHAADDDPGTYRGAVLLVALLDVAVVTAGMVVRSRRRLLASLRARAREAEQGQRLRVEQARHAERERVAREMHDVLAHRISLVAVHAGALEFRRDVPAADRQAAGLVRQCAYDVLEDLREVIGMLRAAEPAGEAERPQPTVDDLPALVRRAGPAVTLRMRLPDGRTVPAATGRHVYRVVQEALDHAGRLAPGAAVSIVVTGSDDAGVTVEVGLVGVAGGGGMVGLAERVELAGGRLTAGRDPAGGIRVRAWLPWRT